MIQCKNGTNISDIYRRDYILVRSRVSLFDVQEWIEELKKRKIFDFEYRELPEELQKRPFIHKAKEVGFLRSIEKDNGRNRWRIVEGVKPK